MCLALVTYVLAAGATVHAASPSRPAGLAGYRLSFSEDFTSPDSIAYDASSNPHAKWFRARFFGDTTTPKSMLSVNKGILTMVGTATQAAQIQTAAPAANDAGWAGRAFRHGAYFEARIAIGGDALATDTAWPAFWSMAIEHMPLRGAAQWPGQPAHYMRFVENDIFEYNPQWSAAAYFVTMWEWYGRWELCQKGRWCNQSNADDPRRAIPFSTDLRRTAFNVYGQKWVPARSGQRGYVQSYLNGRPVGVRVTWRDGEASPPSSADFRFNMIDRQGLVLILTTGGQPMRVDWVRVWQPANGQVDRRSD